MEQEKRFGGGWPGMAGRGEREIRNMKKAGEGNVGEKHDWGEVDWDQLDLHEFDDVPSEEEIASYHKFSPEFEAKMAELFGDLMEADAKREKEGAGAEAAVQCVQEETGAGAEASPAAEVSEVRMTGIGAEAGDLRVDSPAEEACTAEDPRIAGEVYAETEKAGEERSGDADVSRAKSGKKKHRHLGWKLAGCAACLVLALGIWQSQIMEAEAVPVTVVEVFREWLDDFVRVTWGSNQKENGDVIVLDLPSYDDSFILKDQFSVNNEFYFRYEDNEGEQLVIYGSTLLYGLEYNVDDEFEHIKKCEIRGSQCDLYRNSEGKIMVCWENNGTFYQVVYSSAEEKIVEIVENLVKK